MDPDGGDAAVSTSVETPDIPTSTGSILAPSDVNGVDPQVDTDLSTDDREGKSPGAAVPQAASGELPVQTDRKSRSRRSTVTRKPRALSQTNLLDSFKRRTADSDSNNCQHQRQKKKIGYRPTHRNK
ncbi:hypothetical protein ACOMHN_038230 [Nucella lapillus]